VLDHILKHGRITTEELQVQYGYGHPPRAARDVREQGIPLRTAKVKDKQGRTIAAYQLDLTKTLETKKHGGRRALPKRFKGELVERYGEKCASCGATLPARYLQIDHRIPYEVAGEVRSHKLREFMLLCSSCNRAKSWSCEQCKNWRSLKRPNLCRTCYWGNPLAHTHVALQQIRRLDLVWVGDEAETFDRLREECVRKGISVADAIKETMKRR
jgi:hypothetical protein